MSGPGVDRCNPAKTGAPAAPGSKIRASRATRWRIGVLIGIHVLFGLHLWHLYATGSSITPLEPSEAMALATEAVVNTGLIFFALTILATLIFGRFFCGWACHMLALQDLSLALLLKLGIRPKPLRSRALLIVPAAAALYMFVWPLAYRIWTTGGLAVHGVELTTSDFWATFPHPAVAIATFVVCAGLIVYFMGAKGFCTYACPYGAIFALADKVAPGKIRVDDSCDHCGHCTATCTSNVSVAQEVRDWGMVVDVGCMKCMDCVSVCPQGALSFGFGKPTIGAQPRRDPRPAAPANNRWEELLLVVLFAAGYFSVHGLWLMTHQRVPFLFALGVAGVLCGIYLPAVRLMTRPTVSLQNLTFKRNGRLTRAGRVLLLVLTPLTALWIHTGVVRFQEFQAQRSLEALAPWTIGWFEPTRPPMGPGFDAQVSGLADKASWLERWALAEGGLNVQRRMWVSIWQGDLDAAQPLAQEAHRIAPGNADLVIVLGDLARIKGEWEAAAGNYRSALEVRPGHLPAIVKLVPILIETGRRDEAMAALDDALEHHPDHVELLVTHASVCLLIGRPDAAEADLRHAIAVAPDAPGPPWMLAGLLAELGRLDEALDVLDRALERFPQDAALTQSRAALQRALGGQGIGR
jgi:ferredoxin/Tfp pilus assembly protein PilF